MVDDTIRRIIAALALPGFSKRELARLTGLHFNTFLGCDKPEWNPKTSTLREVEKHLPGPGAESYANGIWVYAPATPTRPYAPGDFANF